MQDTSTEARAPNAASVSVPGDRGTRHGSLGPEHAVPTTAQTQEDFSARDMGSNQVVVAVYIPGVERKKFTVYLASYREVP
jgi:hypothetical protein